MSSITFKGVSSDTITGLLISELPPITRPARRVKRTEIDGRDGDIPEFLGYEAYKKSFLIGLYGAFDIDEVSDFFSGEGDLILSNEPTKKYEARLDNEIDFDRLIRFREAKVQFVVQPWKKLVSESDVSSATSPLSVTNQGYEDSKPLIHLSGTADDVIVLQIASVTFATVTIPASGEIYLDSEALNAYDDTADRNNNVVGGFVSLPSGASSISWSGGTVTVTITPRSRYL